MNCNHNLFTTYGFVGAPNHIYSRGDLVSNGRLIRLRPAFSVFLGFYDKPTYWQFMPAQITSHAIHIAIAESDKFTSDPGPTRITGP
uniref:Uncharacterized protein n=1 Tax=Arundo donax TaxID=35708 RepID=A0A0A9BVY7_ARUDO